MAGVKGYKPALPAQIERAAHEADAIVKRMAMRPKPGPVPKTRYRPSAILTADSEETLDALIAAHARAVGKRERGNKRLGAARLYADLVQEFHTLHRKGITLPRNKSLSRNALVHSNLGDVLRKHGYTTETDEALIKNGAKRRALAHRLDRVFARVAEAVEKTTPA